MALRGRGPRTLAAFASGGVEGLDVAVRSLTTEILSRQAKSRPARIEVFRRRACRNPGVMTQAEDVCLLAPPQPVAGCNAGANAIFCQYLCGLLRCYASSGSFRNQRQSAPLSGNGFAFALGFGVDLSNCQSLNP